MQSVHWHGVDYDLSESGVSPLTITELLGEDIIFRYIAPKAGGIAFVEYNLPIDSAELIDRIRRERSVLLVPGDTLGVGRGIRFGYGYDIEHTMAGLARVDEVLAEITR
jgi:aspartate/methionine/tyrosine aminotransferase